MRGPGAGIVALLVAILAFGACTQRAPGPGPGPGPGRASDTSAAAAAPAAPTGTRCPDGMALAAGAAPGAAALCLDTADVTVAKFDQCGPCVASHGFVPGEPERAMTNARPDEKAAYCRSVGRRLATDAELALATARSDASPEGFRCASAPAP